jgi:hypothetical protein
MYRAYDVKIKKEDRKKADEILWQHWSNGDIDGITVNDGRSIDGIETIVYWIRPYIYEDLETIMDEFEQAGIQLL